MRGALGPSARFEHEAFLGGASRIAGIDEAGRGPLAGPVVAAAVVLAVPDCLPHLNDSKLLTPAAREKLFQEIHEHAVGIGVAVISPRVIDEINIYQATRVGMRTAVLELFPGPDYLLIDGNMTLDIDIPQRSIIKGDRLCFSVAAAGIVAKVTRDRIMRELHEQYPEYGFDRHKGYPTEEHRAAIRRHGPCPAHRVCFRGVKEFVQESLFQTTR